MINLQYTFFQIEHAQVQGDGKYSNPQNYVINSSIGKHNVFFYKCYIKELHAAEDIDKTMKKFLKSSGQIILFKLKQ